MMIEVDEEWLFEHSRAMWWKGFATAVLAGVGGAAFGIAIYRLFL